MNTKFLLATVLIMINVAALAAPVATDKGKTLFTATCASCHNVDKKIVGPALAGVEERRSIEWIIKFIRSSQTMIKSGDKEAVVLFEEYNKVAMPDHPGLSDEDIKSILEFVKSFAAAPAATSGSKIHAHLPLSVTNDYQFFLSFLAAVATLILALLFAVHVKSLERKMRFVK